MDAELFMVLVRAHRGDWSEELMGDNFYFIYRNILTANERKVLVYKIDGKTNDYIGKKLGVKPTSIKRITNYILFKYRNGIGPRVDNHPCFNRRRVNWSKRRGG